ncbi:keratin, type I cytoskeletal 9-like [Phlebotomus papatasi]|uniref:keratin, type I cytoskeletal 9-like n=1 Tax=Phlebotomus papatasi TaxID=29031 RepID=UPI002483DC90|nr:keratin, type I cytoskeletal 9-like [Phlebotomus papatasi]
MFTKSVQIAILLTISSAIVAGSGHGGGSDFGGDFDEIHKTGGKLEHLGTYVGKQHSPPKIIRITKTVAVKVPVPVHIPKFIKYPVPFPVHVPKIIKVKEHFPFSDKESHGGHENFGAQLGSGEGGHFEGGHALGGSAQGGQEHQLSGGDASGHGGEASGSYQHEEFSHSGYGNGLGGDLQQSYGGGESYGSGESYGQGYEHQESQAAPVNYQFISQGASSGHDGSGYQSTGGIHEVPAPLFNGGYSQESHGYH